MFEGTRNRRAKEDSGAVVHGGTKKLDVFSNMMKELGERYSREV